MVIEVRGCVHCPLRSSADGAPWCLGARSKRFPNGRGLPVIAVHPEGPVAPQWCPAEAGVVVVLKRAERGGIAEAAARVRQRGLDTCAARQAHPSIGCAAYLGRDRRCPDCPADLAEELAEVVAETAKGTAS